MLLGVAIIQLVRVVLTAKNNVVQNRRKSKRLIECLEAILPPLRTIEAAESKNPMAHRETLEKLKKVEDAKELLEKQGKKQRSLLKYYSSSSVKEQFNDITQRLQAHAGPKPLGHRAPTCGCQHHGRTTPRTARKCRRSSLR